MSDNVLINGRSAVHADSNGTLTTIDVCKTRIGHSTVPIPYVNVAKSSDAAKTASSVLINGNPACHVKSTFSKSTGDQPGNRKGIKSGTIKGEASFVSSSGNVFIEGQPAVRAMDMMVSNKKNTPPAPLVQAIGMAPLAGQVSEPDEIEIEQPDTVGVDQHAESGLSKGSIVAEDPEQ